MNALRDRLPKVRGQYREQADLAKTSWFRVGGPADILFKPTDLSDLQLFLRDVPNDVPVTVLGACSNVIIRDGGIRGVVIKLGRGFADMEESGEHRVRVGAAALDVNVATFAAQAEIAGLEFFSGIPGGIGGALAMNAGAYGVEIKDVLVEAEAVDRQGKLHRVSNAEMGFGYRSNGVDPEWVFTACVLQGKPGKRAEIEARMQEINAKREATQPVRTRTGGSTFANPDGHKAWQLIDQAGLRGFSIGEAKVSEKHCNFLENTGKAKASDLEKLGETVRENVKAQTGIALRWEIKRIGEG